MALTNICSDACSEYEVNMESLEVKKSIKWAAKRLDGHWYIFRPIAEFKKVWVTGLHKVFIEWRAVISMLIEESSMCETKSKWLKEINNFL